MAVRQQFGHLCADAARGLALRHDHGSTFMADVFQQQIKFWGLAPSYAFVAEPETNGVAERFFRTLKELVLVGYYTSEIGATQELRMAPMGSWSGDIPYADVGQAWA